MCFFFFLLQTVSSHYSPVHSSHHSSLSPGQLTCNASVSEMNPKLWVALSGGKVVVFDAASWSMVQDCIQVGESDLVRADTLSFIARVTLLE